MLDTELVELRQRAERGDQDAVDQLVELAGERGDLDELRKLAVRGSSDAVDVLVELAASGHQDAVDVLAELDDDRTDEDMG